MQSREFCTAIGALSTFALLDSPEEMILFAALGALLSGLFWGTLMSTGSDSSKDGNLLRRSLCVGLLAACLTLTIPAITYVCYLVASADFCEPDQAFECLPEDYIEAGVCICVSRVFHSADKCAALNLKQKEFKSCRFRCSPQ